MGAPVTYPLVAFMALTGALASPLPTSAGEVNGKRIDATMRYKITRCAAPKRQKLRAKNIEEFNAAAARYEVYATAQQAYADCIKQEAQQDLKDIQNAIFAGAQAQVSRIQTDLDAMRAQLDAIQNKLQSKQQ